MATSKTARQSLRRLKLDFTERIREDSLQVGALRSHSRPHTLEPVIRKPDRVLDRPNTEPLPG